MTREFDHYPEMRDLLDYLYHRWLCLCERRRGELVEPMSYQEFKAYN